MARDAPCAFPERGEEEGAFLSWFLAREQSQARGGWDGFGLSLTPCPGDIPAPAWPGPRTPLRGSGGHLGAAVVTPRDIGEQQGWHPQHWPRGPEQDKEGGPGQAGHLRDDEAGNPLIPGGWSPGVTPGVPRAIPALRLQRHPVGKEGDAITTKRMN